METEFVKLEDIEEKTFEEDDTDEVPPPDVFAYNELRSCADLFRMWKDGILEISPAYQRNIVWKDSDQTRFIDSLIKQLPIPSMCFSLDFKTQKWQVIDGLQRMATITRFLSSNDWKLSRLDDINPKISGVPVSSFANRNSDLHKFYSQIENLALPVTILRCDYSKADHAGYIFTIFHRLNTGGMKLNNQEIRNCIYSGPLNDFLKSLDSNANWMRINKMKNPGDYRYTKQEIILRFFAFYNRYESYKGRLAKFLNTYMEDNRFPSKNYFDEKKDLFVRTVDIIYKAIFAGKIPKKLSISVLEAILIGVAFNLPYLETQSINSIQNLYAKLLKHDELSEKKLREGLARRERVISRIKAAKEVFSGQYDGE